MIALVAVKFARAYKIARVHKIARKYFCTEPFLHEGTKLHEDKIAFRLFARWVVFVRGYIIARADNFARRVMQKKN